MGDGGWEGCSMKTPSFQDSASRGLLQSSSSLSQERGTVRKPPRVGGEVLLSVRIDVSDWLVGWAGGRVGERTVEERGEGGACSLGGPGEAVAWIG